MNIHRNPWVTVTLFAIAMGLLEAIVVVYLRELYYPEGFGFPLKAMKPGIAGIELLRELATLVMLITVGVITGKTATGRFAWFIYSFAIWDLFYYVFLKVLLGWPDSFFTWDILFLIPVTWVGPVLGPLINSFTMIVLAVILIRGNTNRELSLNSFEWILLVSGSLIIFLAYTKEYTSFMLSKFTIDALLNPSNSKELLTFATSFIPIRFDWVLFLAGVLLQWLAMCSAFLRTHSGFIEVRSKRSEIRGQK